MIFNFHRFDVICNLKILSDICWSPTGCALSEQALSEAEDLTWKELFLKRPGRYHLNRSVAEWIACHFIYIRLLPWEMLGGDSEKTQINHESWQIVINQCWNAVQRIYLVQLAFSTLSSFIVWRGCSTSWIIEIFHVTVVVLEFRNLNDNLWMSNCLCIQRKTHNLYIVNLEWQWAASKSIKWIKRFSCMYIIQTYGIHAHTYMPQINVHATRFYKKDKQLNCKWFVLLNLQCILSMILFFVLSCQLLWHGHPVEFGDLCTKLHLLMSASAWQRDIWHCRGSRKKKRMQRSRYRQGISGFFAHVANVRRIWIQNQSVYEKESKLVRKWLSFLDSCLQNSHRINFNLEIAFEDWWILKLRQPWNALNMCILRKPSGLGSVCLHKVTHDQRQFYRHWYLRFKLSSGVWTSSSCSGGTYSGFAAGSKPIAWYGGISSYLVMMCFDIIDSDLWHA